MDNIQFPHRGLYGTSPSLGEPFTIAATITAVSKAGKIADFLKNAVPSIGKIVSSIFGWECPWKKSWCNENVNAYISKLYKMYQDTYSIDDVSGLNAQQNVNNLNRMMLDLASIRYHADLKIPQFTSSSKDALTYYKTKLDQMQQSLIKAYTEYFSLTGKRLYKAGTLSSNSSLGLDLKNYTFQDKITYDVYKVEGQDLLDTGKEWVQKLISKTEKSKVGQEVFDNSQNISTALKTAGNNSTIRVIAFAGIAAGAYMMLKK